MQLENRLENCFWPKNAKLFQPPKEQLLLPDYANCLFMQTYLSMCNLKFEIVHRQNVEHMSPTGSIPFLVCGDKILSEKDALMRFVESFGESLTYGLEMKHKLELHAYMSLVRNTLENAEQYVTWYYPNVYSQSTWKKYSSPYPWPLNYILTHRKRKRIIRRLEQLQWCEKSIEEVYEDIETCFRSLSALLADNKFFFANQPTEIDASVFAHLHAALASPLLAEKYCQILEAYPNIVGLYDRVGSKYRFSGNGGTGDYHK